MYNNLQIKLQNTLAELKSFPIDQSLVLEFSESVEDSYLSKYVYLVQGLDSPGLIHVGDTFNQNVGIVKESFNNVDISITVTNRSPFTVKITPIKPLTPGYSYTLLVKGDLPNEYMSITKSISHSSSNIELLGTDHQSEEAVLVFNEDSVLTSNKHTVDLTLNTTRKTFDITRKKDIVIDGYTLRLPSDFYLEGETFNILVVDKTATTNSYTVSLTTSPSKNIKPIDPTNNNQLTYEDLIKYNQETEQTIVEEDLSYTITYTGIGSFIITFNKEITDKLDIDAIVYKNREAFGMYTLTAMKLYDQDIEYTVTTSILDKKSIEFFVKEVKR